MAVRKFTETDGFVVVDFADAPAAGVLRRAKKVLQSSASDLARSASYTFASFDMKRSGASGGINAEGEAIDPAIEAVCTELASDVESGSLHLHPGKGVSADQLSVLTTLSGLNPVAGSPKATIAGVIAAASWAVGGSLDGKRVAIEQTAAGPSPEGLDDAVTAMGGQIVSVPDVDEKPWMIWGADVDLILAGSKPGTLTHQGAEMVKASAIVPWGPIPVTTKALAIMLKKNETIVVPDFVSASGGLVAGYLDGEGDDIIKQIVSSVTTMLIEVADHEQGVLLGACHRAEAFMSSWQPTLPFGRPLAA